MIQERTVITRSRLRQSLIAADNESKYYQWETSGGTLMWSITAGGHWLNVICPKVNSTYGTMLFHSIIFESWTIDSIYWSCDLRSDEVIAIYLDYASLQNTQFPGNLNAGSVFRLLLAESSWKPEKVQRIKLSFGKTFKMKNIQVVSPSILNCLCKLGYWQVMHNVHTHKNVSVVMRVLIFVVQFSCELFVLISIIINIHS